MNRDRAVPAELDRRRGDGHAGDPGRARALPGRANCVAVCKPYVADVLAGSPWFADIDPRSTSAARGQRLLGVARQAAREADSTPRCCSRTRSAPRCSRRLGGCRSVVGFARYGRGLLLTDKLHAEDRRPRAVRAVAGHRRLQPARGRARHARPRATGWNCSPRPPTRPPRTRCGSGSGLHRYPQVVCLNPGAAFGAAKHWPARPLRRPRPEPRSTRRGCGVLVLCGPAERDMARQIADGRAASPHVFSLGDTPLSLGLTKALVRRADLLVTTDSGPRHFAAAFDRPVVTLFGPTHIDWTETYFAKAIHLQKKVPCGPCQQRVCPLDHRCMTRPDPGRGVRRGRTAAHALPHRSPGGGAACRLMPSPAKPRAASANRISCTRRRARRNAGRSRGVRGALRARRADHRERLPRPARRGGERARRPARGAGRGARRGARILPEAAAPRRVARAAGGAAAPGSAGRRGASARRRSSGSSKRQTCRPRGGRRSATHGGRAFLLVEEVAGASDLRRVLRDNALSLAERRRLAEAIGEAVAAVHAAGFSTPDLTAKHVLVHPASLAVTFLDWQSGARGGERRRPRRLRSRAARIARRGTGNTARAVAALRAYLSSPSPLAGEGGESSSLVRGRAFCAIVSPLTRPAKRRPPSPARGEGKKSTRSRHPPRRGPARDAAERARPASAGSRPAAAGVARRRSGVRGAGGRGGVAATGHRPALLRVRPGRRRRTSGSPGGTRCCSAGARPPRSGDSARGCGPRRGGRPAPPRAASCSTSSGTACRPRDCSRSGSSS